MALLSHVSTFRLDPHYPVLIRSADEHSKSWLLLGLLLKLISSREPGLSEPALRKCLLSLPGDPGDRTVHDKIRYYFLLTRGYTVHTQLVSSPRRSSDYGHYGHQCRVDGYKTIHWSWGSRMLLGLNAVKSHLQRSGI